MNLCGSLICFGCRRAVIFRKGEVTFSPIAQTFVREAAACFGQPKTVSVHPVVAATALSYRNVVRGRKLESLIARKVEDCYKWMAAWVLRSRVTPLMARSVTG